MLARRLPFRRCVILSVGVLSWSAVLSAQSPEHDAPRITTMQQGAVFGINVALGAATAAVRAWRGDRPVTAALWKGAVGGVIMGGGIAIGRSRAPAGRLMSVQTVAVGASIAGNAGAGRPILSRVTLPFSPFIVELGVHPTRARVRLSAVALTGIAARLSAGHGMRVDWRETRATGGVVFRTSSPAYSSYGACPVGYGCERTGDHLLGTIAYASGGRTRQEIQATLAHESMHMAQHTRDLVLFGIPAGDAVLGRGGRVGRAVRSALAVDFFLPLSAVSLTTGEASGSQHRAWFEVEARAFAPGSAGTFDPPLP